MSQHWNPLQDLVVLQDRMSRLFEDAIHGRAREKAETGDEFEQADWTPAADIYESEANYLIAIDLPGIDRSTLSIDLDDDRLVVKGGRLLEGEAKGHRRERPRGKFLRTFSLPGSVNQSEIVAEYKDGVLQIDLPKRKEQKAKRIEIRIS